MSIALSARRRGRRLAFLLGAIALQAPTVAAAQAAPPTDTRPTVAVMYFTNGVMGNTAEYDALKKGLAEMLITELSVNPNIRVVERDRLQALIEEQDLAASGRVDGASAVRIGRLLSARHILFGTFVIDGKKAMRMDVRAINTETGEQAYATSVTGKADGMLGLLADLGAKVNSGLKLPALPAGVQHGSEAAVKSPNQLRAMMLLSRALEQQDRKNTSGAIQLYKEALAVNPDLTRAKVLLASLEQGGK